MSFKKDIIAGLDKTPKQLNSKYFYDERGSKLFQSIMQLPEYYLTGAEMEILREQSDDIWNMWSREIGTGKARVIELGAGDGVKTKYLLQAGLKRGMEIHYTPIDISSDVFTSLEKNIPKGVHYEPIAGDFFEGLAQMAEVEGIPSLILFLGSNIGNMTATDATGFLSKVRSKMNPDDRMLLGVDLLKSPNKIRKAYNDPSGVTASFNKNLLYRINRELKANFDPDYFEHYAMFNPESGEARSYLVSMRQQNVQIGDRIFSFAPWEYIHMEISKKYSPEEAHQLIDDAGFELVERFMDCKHYFSDILIKSKI